MPSLFAAYGMNKWDDRFNQFHWYMVRQVLRTAWCGELYIWMSLVNEYKHDAIVVSITHYYIFLEVEMDELDF